MRTTALMNFEQYRFLRYIRYSPRTVAFLRAKLRMTMDDFKLFLEDVSECYDYGNRVSDPDALLIHITTYGKIMCDERRRQNIHWYVPLVVSIIALVVSIAAFFR